MGDVSISTVHKIIESLKTISLCGKCQQTRRYKNLLKKEIENILEDSPMLVLSEKNPTIFLVTGVNGVGKTSSIAKMANMFHKRRQIGPCCCS
jgi:fused signal recognition particle receptor